MTTKRALIGITAAVAAAATLTFALTANGGANYPGSVTPASIAPLELTLSDPQGPTPTATAAAAASSNAAAAVHATAVGQNFMHCVDPGTNLDQDCWVITVDPSTVKYPGSRVAAPAQWSIVLVDPKTSQPLWQFSGSGTLGG